MFEQALRRIAANRQSQSPVLDLSGCELETLPVELVALTWLESLNLSDTKIRDLSPLTRLRLLEQLNLRGTPVNDLDPLSALIELRSLDAAGSHVADLRALSKLPKLATS